MLLIEDVAGADDLTGTVKKNRKSDGLPVATEPAKDKVTHESTTSSQKRQHRTITPSSDNADKADSPTPQPGCSGQQKRGRSGVRQPHSKKLRSGTPVTKNQTVDSPRPPTDNSDVPVTDSDNDSCSTTSSRSEDTLDTDAEAQLVKDAFLEFSKDPQKAESIAKDTGRGNCNLYQFGKFWFSKDTAGHAGSECKVFKDTKHKLIFIGSVDESGNIIPKHESMEDTLIRKSRLKNLK